MDVGSPTSLRGARSPSGFTLVEMLIVIVLIGILVSLSIQGLQVYRERAADAAVKADLRNALAAEEGYYSTRGSYVAFSVADGGVSADPEFTASANVDVDATLDGSDVRIEGSHAASTTAWCINSSSGKIVEGTGC